MSTYKTFNKHTIWRSGNFAVEYFPGNPDRNFFLVEWLSPTNDDVLFGAHGSESFLLKANMYLTSIEMAGLVVTLTNLGHLS